MIKEHLRPAEWAAEIEALAAEFQRSEPLMRALGNEMRQRLILIMIKHADGRGTGMRVGEIATEMNLSRPAASHHLKILKDCGLVTIRQEGTKNYYSFNRDAPSIAHLITMLTHADHLLHCAPDEPGAPARKRS